MWLPIQAQIFFLISASIEGGGGGGGTQVFVGDLGSTTMYFIMLNVITYKHNVIILLFLV